MISSRGLGCRCAGVSRRAVPHPADRQPGWIGTSSGLWQAVPIMAENAGRSFLHVIVSAGQAVFSGLVADNAESPRRAFLLFAAKAGMLRCARRPSRGRDTERQAAMTTWPWHQPTLRMPHRGRSAPRPAGGRAALATAGLALACLAAAGPSASAAQASAHRASGPLAAVPHAGATRAGAPRVGALRAGALQAAAVPARPAPSAGAAGWLALVST